MLLVYDLPRFEFIHAFQDVLFQHIQAFRQRLQHHRTSAQLSDQLLQGVVMGQAILGFPGVILGHTSTNVTNIQADLLDGRM